MSVVNIGDHEFQEKVVQSDKLVVVDFWAEWCGPCRALAPKLEEISNEMSETVQVVKINVDTNKDNAQKFGIRSIPAMFFFKNGEVVDQISGNVDKEEIVSKIQTHI